MLFGFRFRVWMLSFFIARGRGTWWGWQDVDGCSPSELTPGASCMATCPDLSPAELVTPAALFGELLPPGLALSSRPGGEKPVPPQPQGAGGPGGLWGCPASAPG